MSCRPGAVTVFSVRASVPILWAGGRLGDHLECSPACLLRFQQPARLREQPRRSIRRAVSWSRIKSPAARILPVPWFNPAAFAAPPACVAYSASNPKPCAVGNTQRNQFRGPGYFSDNVSIFKSFPIFRESSLEARFDAFDMSNTPAFGLPNGTLGSNLGKITGTLGSGVGNVNGVASSRVLEASVKISF